jgi:hypothetical protein
MRTAIIAITTNNSTRVKPRRGESVLHIRRDLGRWEIKAAKEKVMQGREADDERITNATF